MTDTHMTANGAIREIGDGARKQAAVIRAIVFKDFRIKLGRGRLGLIWILLEPMVQMFMMSSIWYLAGRTSIAGIHVMLFISTGVLPFMIFRMGVSRLHSSVHSNVSLFDYQQVKPIDAILASFIFNAVLLLIAAALMYFVLHWFFALTPSFPKIPELIGIFALLICFSIGIGLLVAVYSTFIESLPRAVNIATKPMLFISGVLYSVTELPDASREVLAWNPVLQYLHFIRHYGLGVELMQEASLLYIGLFAAVTLFLGCLSYQTYRHRILQR